MAGIQQTKDVLKTAALIGNGVGISLQDGKFDLSDLTNFVNALISLPTAVDGITEVPTELKDLDPAERTELLNYFSQEFDIPHDKTEEAIEDHIEFLFALWKIVDKYYL